MKKIISIAVFSVVVTLIVVLIIMGVAGHRRAMTTEKCRAIEVELTDSSKLKFITAEQVKSIIDHEYGGYINVPMGNVNLDKMEKILASHGIMERHEAYFTGDAVLHIKVSQSIPVIKIIGEKGIWYLCSNKRYFKIKDDWCEGIPQIKGPAKNTDDKWMKQITDLGLFIRDNAMKYKTEALWCNSRGEISLTLADNSETFKLGQPSNLSDKFKRIDTYLNKIKNNTAEDKTYKTVDVKYDRQIVCR